jgi:large subunit ribosomal protein L10
MPRPEKVQAVAEIKERIEGARAVFLTEYAGLSVKDQQTLRRELRASGSEFKVVKMTLARRAAAELENDEFNELLIGPTGLTFSDEDAVTTAKTLKEFAKTHEVFVIKGGLLGSEFLTPETISELAEIEPRDVLLAKFAGAMKAPMANLAGLVAALPRNAASMFQQLLEKKESAAPEPVADDIPADEAPETEAAEETAPEADAPVEDARTEEVETGADAQEAAEEAVEEADEAPGAVDETTAPEASTDDDSEQTEDDDSEAKVEASDDAEDETDDETEASDDAEEE